MTQPHVMPRGFKSKLQTAFYEHDVDRIVELNSMWQYYLRKLNDGEAEQ
ncbi:cortex morphogenetic protein CmpA [Geomicrobium sp. JCM 19037]|nr:cortex morphogenetic protein CmpA [Geomicrobium sp. JCM 19037]